jgi:sugar phosphate isomerase/epimerase
MIRSAVTVSLVPAAAGGPFVFWYDLPAAVESAKRLGFDAIELFAAGPDDIPPIELGRMLRNAGLRLAAVGTGAGWVKHKLTLTDADPEKRRAARDFVRKMIDFGAAAGIEAAGPDGAAHAIIGSMQGRHGGEVTRGTALRWLADELSVLGEHATTRNARLLYEPLNRYETNLINTLADGSALLRMLSSRNVRLLADLYHMNIEELDSAATLAATGQDIGHIHFVDSNRRPAGNGHIDYAPIALALERIKYSGYASAEALPYPDSLAAAEQTIKAFRRIFGSSKN